MEITIVATVFLLWFVLGGIAAILICPRLKEANGDAASPSFERTRAASLRQTPQAQR